MAKPYTINIVDGSGQEQVVNGSYTVSSNVVGYDNTSITPTSLTVDGTTTTYNFTIAANGTLTLHVTEDGTVSGTPVVGATFNRTDSAGDNIYLTFVGTDSEGNVYGSLITTDSNGDAVFNNVPFSETGAPIVYYKQISSDGNHNFDNTVKNTTLTTSTATIQIENQLPALQTFNLTDENYDGLTIATGTITLS